ncbi:hypothetical protein SAMN05444320_115101 [Streptoalloteichus hindustanus]|uniref:Uncharacterized protein n=1 Tax=Streptoalloteichus hindustanus TaxID=2017 RepID=A0A1M5NDH2_STRHI|nr:hypothetical protein SAMN05444320_115101 [Streptoalloteichus hindustanus]
MSSLRLIPACAGPTAPSAPIRGVLWTHPRVRGADPPPLDPPLRLDGSSPRVRGRLDLDRAYATLRRLIPARAGPTMPPAEHEVPRWAHPRACGADVRVVAVREYEGGSSPRVRGRRLPQDRQGVVERLIPARAGPTGTAPAGSRPPRAHPRVRGADAGGQLSVLPTAGSSPRARGRRASAVSGVDVARLIPACAGPTRASGVAAGPARAHPRVRGADCSPSRPMSWRGGSSPRARGRHAACMGLIRTFRLIPACAGPTLLDLR